MGWEKASGEPGGFFAGKIGPENQAFHTLRYAIFILPVDKFVKAIPKNVRALDFDLSPIITPVIMVIVCSTEGRQTKPSQMAIRSIEEFYRTHQIEYDMNGGADHADRSHYD